jgi:hypothetical protein
MIIPHSQFFWIRTLVGDDDRAQGRIPPDVPLLALRLQIIIQKRKTTNRIGYPTRHRQKHKVRRRGYSRTYLGSHGGQHQCIENSIERPKHRPPHDQDKVCEGLQ